MQKGRRTASPFSQNFSRTPTRAEMPMNTMGCHFFTTGTQLVHTSSTAASAMAGQFSAEKPVIPLCSKAIGTTEMPAAATSAVEAGR